MHAESVVKFAHDRGWQPAHAGADALDSYRPDALGLRLGISGKAGLAGLEQNLEGVNPGNVRGDGHYGDHAASQLTGHWSGWQALRRDCRVAGVGPLLPTRWRMLPHPGPAPASPTAQVLAGRPGVG